MRAAPTPASDVSHESDSLIEPGANLPESEHLPADGLPHGRSFSDGSKVKREGKREGKGEVSTVKAADDAEGSGSAGVFDAAIEAIVFSAERAVGAGKIAEALTQAAVVEGRADGSLAVIDEQGVRSAIARLNDEYAKTGRAFGIESVAGGYRVMTRAEYAPAVAAFHGARASATLSRPAMETLAIVAYKQPVTRAQLEAVRGVSCGEVLRSLIDRKLITITGRAEELGRPMLYGTTKRFLEVFGLASLKELPDVDEFRRRAAEAQAMAEAQESEQVRQRQDQRADSFAEPKDQAIGLDDPDEGGAIGDGGSVVESYSGSGETSERVVGTEEADEGEDGGNSRVSLA